MDSPSQQGAGSEPMSRSMLLNGFRLGSKTIWPQQGRVESLAGTLRLEPRVMDLLVYLAASPGQVVSRDAIIKDVWRGTMVTDDVISRSIYLARKSQPSGERIEIFQAVAAIEPIIDVFLSDQSSRVQDR